MSIQFALSLKPNQQAKFDRAIANLKGGDLVEAAMLKVGTVYLAYLHRRFASASRGDGTWAATKASTRASRIQAAFASSRQASTPFTRSGSSNTLPGSKLILRRTDALFNSLVPGAPGNVLKVSGSKVRVGTSIFYAKFHQSGTRKMPARKIIVPPDSATRLAAKRLLIIAVRTAFHRTN